MKPILTTLFDSNYLPKGLAFIRSLQTHHDDFALYVLALDDATEYALRALEDERIQIISLSLLESDVMRRTLKETRTLTEYYWTLTPFLTHAVLNAFRLPHLAYMDADCFLFSPLDALYREVNWLRTGETDLPSVGIIPHRFPPRLAWRARENGIYNVSWVFFRNDSIGNRALTDWNAQCWEWCYQRTERASDGSTKFGDQGYLDHWPKKYDAHEIKNLGANLAPWNQEQYRYCFDNWLYVIKHRSLSPPGVAAGRSEETPIERIDRVVFYHFHELNFVRQRRSITFSRGGYNINPDVLKHLYLPYESTLSEVYQSLALA